jgi:hypothetical protein
VTDDEIRALYRERRHAQAALDAVDLPKHIAFLKRGKRPEPEQLTSDRLEQIHQAEARLTAAEQAIAEYRQRR